MDYDVTIMTFIVIGIILVFGIILIVLYNRILSKRREFVIENSLLIAALKRLNASTHFFELNPTYECREYCNSKKSFEKISCSELMQQCVASELSYYRDLILKSEANRRNYLQYIKDCEKLKCTVRSAPEMYTEHRYFAKTEEYLFDECTLKPVTDLEICMYKSYTSPAGRNHYEDSQTYNSEHIRIFVSNVKAENAVRDSIRVERARMTDSLRYDVMKRDGFRCQICGATQADGVKLHVDHIRPVSKGGKTVMSNLRTLCDRCNLGKSAKYDSYGKN